MAAIIKTGGKQYRVNEGDILRVEKLNVPAGDKVVFKEVLGVSTEKGFQVGTPLVKGASVEGKVLKHDKAKKIIVFKYKAKKDYRKKQGHRQPYSQVQIEKIVLGGGSKTSKAEAETAAAVKTEEKPAAKKTTTAKSTTAKKASTAKSTAAKSTAAKKDTTAKSASTKAAAEKKPTAKKTSTAKSTAAKSSTAKKTTAAKSTTAKSAAAKKTTSSTAKKSTAAKSSTAKKSTTSTAKKPAAKKTATKKTDDEK